MRFRRRAYVAFGELNRQLGRLKLTGIEVNIDNFLPEMQP